MEPLPVVPLEIGRQAIFGLGDIPIVMEVDFLLFDGPPETFHEDIIQGSSPSIHADLDGVGLEKIQKSFGGVLGSLIRIEDLGNGPLQDPGERGTTELRVHTDRDLPVQNIARIPVHDGGQIHKAFLEPDVGDVRTEDLIRTDKGHILQKIRIDFVFPVSFRQGGLGIDGLQSHKSHQAKDPLGIHRVSLGSKPGRHPSIAIDGNARILFVD